MAKAPQASPIRCLKHGIQVTRCQASQPRLGRQTNTRIMRARELSLACRGQPVKPSR